MAAHFRNSAPITFSWIVNAKQMKIHCFFLRDIPLMYSCMETNTYVLGPNVIRYNTGTLQQDDEILDLLTDMHNLHEMPLPYGQIMFFSYYEAGEFIVESATENFSAHKAVLAFESFGYKGARLLTNRMVVSEQDKFKLMLKHGY